MIKDENGCYTGALKGNDKHGVGVMMFETGEEYFGLRPCPEPFFSIPHSAMCLEHAPQPSCLRRWCIWQAIIDLAQQQARGSTTAGMVSGQC